MEQNKNMGNQRETQKGNQSGQTRQASTSQQGQGKGNISRPGSDQHSGNQSTGKESGSQTSRKGSTGSGRSEGM